jgi:hypothetical protein
MGTATLSELARDPAGLIGRARADGTVVIITGDADPQPLAELRPLPDGFSSPRPFGLAEGAFAVPADFDAPLPDEFADAFEGR